MHPNDPNNEENAVQSMPAKQPGRMLNPFESERKNQLQSSGGLVEVQRAIAETQAAIMLAKQFPRDKVDATDRILTECTRPTLAEAATYSYTKGGTEVTGPSIRLAEVVAMNWGNFTFGWKETGRRTGSDGVGVSEIQTYAWDYETNVRAVREFSVRHYRDTKKGGYPIKDERDIYELCANQAARRMRACVLQIIPGDVIEAAVQQCETTMVQNEVVTPESIKKLLEAFEGIGVSKSQIEKRLGRKVTTELSGAVMAQLRRIFSGIRDGMAKPEEFFEPEAGGMTTATVKEGEKIDAGAAVKVESGVASNAIPSSDWEAFAEEMIVGLQGCADEKTIDAYMGEVEENIGKLQASKDKAAMQKWSQAVLKRRKEVSK